MWIFFNSKYYSATQLVVSWTCESRTVDTEGWLWVMSILGFWQPQWVWNQFHTGTKGWLYSLNKVSLNIGTHKAKLRIDRLTTVLHPESFSLFFSHKVMADSFWPNGLQLARFPVLHYFPELAQTLVHWVGDAIQSSISSSVTPFSYCPQAWSASGSFPMSWLFASCGQSIEASASASVLPVNIGRGLW